MARRDLGIGDLLHATTLARSSSRESGSRASVSAADAIDIVDEASSESFPASDAPSWMTSVASLAQAEDRMNLGLKGKRAVVTGSTAGIGFAIAHVLSREGARVVVNGRSQARVTSAIDKIRATVDAADVSGVAADLATAEGSARLIAKVPDADVLVNSLGIFEPKPFLEIPDSDWLRFFEVNVLSGVRLTRHYLPGMLKNDWGRIIFISSESAQQIPVEMIHYGMTKTAQIAVARGVAESVAGTGVTVNSVLAGPTASEGVGAFVEQLATERGITPAELEREFFQTARPTSLLKRFARPDEIAAVVAFVASAQATTINGAAVRADGGVVRSIL